MLLVGSRPSGRATFLLPRKVGQRGAPAAAPSGNLCRGICGVCRITHCALRAPFKQTRHVRSRSADTLRSQRHPANTTPQARAKKGVTRQPNIHTGHRCARPPEPAEHRRLFAAKQRDAVSAEAFCKVICQPSSASASTKWRYRARSKHCLSEQPAQTVVKINISKNSMNSFAINIDSELGLAKFGEMATLGLTDPTKLDRCSYRQMQ